jgi:hypothetical protein
MVGLVVGGEPVVQPADVEAGEGDPSRYAVAA